jgi:hypothetical protein
MYANYLNNGAMLPKTGQTSARDFLALFSKVGQRVDVFCEGGQTVQTLTHNLVAMLPLVGSVENIHTPIT